MSDLPGVVVLVECQRLPTAVVVMPVNCCLLTSVESYTPSSSGRGASVRLLCRVSSFQRHKIDTDLDGLLH